MAKWLVTLKAEVEAETIKEAREKAIGVFWNTCNIKKLRKLEFKKLN